MSGQKASLTLHRRQTIFETQAFVGQNMVYHGRIIGVPLGHREG